jgi:NADPH-dependent glutamate synthase beta subunit-like oxidoreductase/NAD-dependent dihydropyrimidine dehydrogenase PreA subunit
VGTDAAAYVALIAEGRIAEAYDVARAPNPLVSVCGRVCAAPCEAGCRRGVIDRPVAIRALKRVLTERYGVEAGERSRWSEAIRMVPEATRPSVGIIGAGPAGLSAAHDLRLAGHAVTLYERGDKPGGMLTYGAPAFRLPRDVAEAEFQAILDLGVTLKTGCAVGSDIAIETLLERHAAVLIAVGCQAGRVIGLPGMQLDGVMHAVDFLLRCNTANTAHAVSGPCVVIGGGSVAFDAARSAVRRPDAESRHAVTLVAPESSEQLNAPPEEVAQAREEGVQLRTGFGVRRIVGGSRVKGVEIAPVLSLFDGDGNFAPELDPGKSETLDARSVILAVGQQAETSFLAAVSAVESAPWGGVQADHHGRTVHPRIFAAGDVATGPRDLIEAVAFGQRAAAAIVQSLGSGPDQPIPRRAITPEPVPHAPPLSEGRRYWSGYDVMPRAEFPVTPVDQRSPSAEVELAFSTRSARRQASRCLRCDEHLQLSANRCIACGLCEDICPSGCLALAPAGNGVQVTVDDDRCIRCRLCVDRCPGDALDFSLVIA